MQGKKLKDERETNSIRNKKVSVLAINKNAAPLKGKAHQVGSISELAIQGKGKNYRHGSDLRDSIVNINHERI